MSFYKKKPVIIEAFRFGCENEPKWFLAEIENKKVEVNRNGCKIRTLEGIMECNEGDYIIKGVLGELYPCKADIFKETYELMKK